jgi:phosphoglycolate phosphatase
VITGVVFDFDGTLTELTLDFKGMRDALEAIVVRYLSPEALRRFNDLLMLEMIYAVEKRLGSKGTVFRGEAFSLLRVIEVDAARGKEVFPYTRNVLDSLKKMGVALGVMTRNCGDAVRKVFPDIDAYVDAVVTREDVPIVKPDPAHPIAVLRRLGVQPQKALLVGDHPTDVEAGRAAGSRTVGVLSGKARRSEMVLAKADYIVDDIRQVPEIVTRSNTRHCEKEVKEQ